MIVENLTEEERYLYVLLQDYAGIDQCEFALLSEEHDDGCWRAWPFQWTWWRDRGELQIDQSARSIGKALLTSTPILTSEGWSTMGDLRVGDKVLDSEGEWTTVIAAHEPLVGRPCYRLKFDDGSTLIADEGHEWVTDAVDGGVGVRTTRELADTLTAAGRRNHRIRVAGVADGVPVGGTLSPYALGYWLGDGSSHTGELTIGAEDAAAVIQILSQEGIELVQYSEATRFGMRFTETWELLPESGPLDPLAALTTPAVQAMRGRHHDGERPADLAADFNVTASQASRILTGQTYRSAGGWIRPPRRKSESVKAELARLGVLGGKHIPDAFLRGTWSERLALLQGLMDSDGHCGTQNGRCEITQKSERLAEQIYDLLVSLGQKPRFEKRTARCNGVEAGPVYRVHWPPWGLNPFRLERKSSRVVTPRREIQVTHRILDSVEAIESLPVRCIEVAAPNHLFLVGRQLIATHNSQSIAARAIAFPFVHPGNEMLITAPEKVHLDAITNKIETEILNSRLFREMLQGRGGRTSFKHQPFMANFDNGARILGRIPQRDGRGVKGCIVAQAPILTAGGVKRAKDVITGDLVWTHEGWREVQSVEHDTAETTYEVRGQGSFPLMVSWEHRFYGAHDAAKIPGKQKRDFSEGLEWCSTEHLIEEHFYWATPRKFDPLPVPQNGALDQTVDDFWWFVGRFLADGYVDTNQKRLSICAHKRDHRAIFDRLINCGAGYSVTRRDHSTGDQIWISGAAAMTDWLTEHFGKYADGKKIPAWALGMPEARRSALLEGYLSGDGHWDAERQRWHVGTASEFLAVGIQMLAQSLDYQCSGHRITKTSNYVTEIAGQKLKNPAKDSYRFNINMGDRGVAVRVEDYLVGKVKSIKPTGPQPVVNIITDVHSYMSGSIMSHNMHPLWLEQDEASDYPEAGWTELTETLKRDKDGNAVWRAHGVTRGVRDSFFKFTQPGSGWQVHRITSMHRPTWTDGERQQKILQYSSKDAPDYRRNILGMHGDNSSPLFVLHRLMECVDSDELSEYNTDIYQHLRLTGEMIEADGVDFLLRFNSKHHAPDYLAYWAGVDIGWTSAPTEILLFGEKKHGKAKGDGALTLLLRLNLKRVSGPDQIDIMRRVIEEYHPKALALDATGAGLPLYQDLQKDRKIAKIVKGYNFKEKILVDFDKSIDVDPLTGDLIKEAGIKRQVLDYSTDLLRRYVDDKRLWLPWDKNLIGQFQGGSVELVKANTDEYGRRRISSSAEDHALDAARMAVLAHGQNVFDQMVEQMLNYRQPVIDSFMIL